MKKRLKNAVAIVAHPDDETLWAGGTILRRRDHSWTILSVCRGGDQDRAPRFRRALERLGAEGAMADLDDGPEQRPLDVGLITRTVLPLLPHLHFDMLLTHSPFGEYTRHRRHEETSRAVTRLWADGRLKARELWLFAYDDGGGDYLPRAIDRAHFQAPLSDILWTEKGDIVQNVYGFKPDSWEARVVPRVEAFWCFHTAREFRDWFEMEQALKRGGS